MAQKFGKIGILEILKKYAEKDKRIIVLHQENHGVEWARATALKHVSSEYIMFCDPDDWYEVDMCEKMYKAITENDVDFACCGVNIRYDEDTHLKKSDGKYYTILKIFPPSHTFFGPRINLNTMALCVLR